MDMLLTEPRETKEVYPTRPLVSALGYLLFGGLLCLIDVNIKSDSMIIDVVPDAIGFAIIIAALAVLSRVRLGPIYSVPIAFTQVVAVLSLVHSIVAIWAVNPGWGWKVVSWGIAAAQGLAGVAFCGAMMVFARSIGAARSYKFFRSARSLVGLFFAGPLLVIFCWGLLTGRLETEYPLSSLAGWFVIMAIVVGLLTLLQLFISVRQLQHELKALA
jgi:hypothetical protein